VRSVSDSTSNCFRPDGLRRSSTTARVRLREPARELHGHAVRAPHAHRVPRPGRLDRQVAAIRVDERDGVRRRRPVVAHRDEEAVRLERAGDDRRVALEDEAAVLAAEGRLGAQEVTSLALLARDRGDVDLAPADPRQQVLAQLRPRVADERRDLLAVHAPDERRREALAREVHAHLDELVEPAAEPAVGLGDEQPHEAALP
jgi:hypothetical protein